MKKTIQESLERIKQIPEDKCDDRIKELIRQILAFIDYKNSPDTAGRYHLPLPLTQPQVQLFY